MTDFDSPSAAMAMELAETVDVVVEAVVEWLTVMLSSSPAAVASVPSVAVISAVSALNS